MWYKSPKFECCHSSERIVRTVCSNHVLLNLYNLSIIRSTNEIGWIRMWKWFSFAFYLRSYQGCSWNLLWPLVSVTDMPDEEKIIEKCQEAEAVVTLKEAFSDIWRWILVWHVLKYWCLLLFISLTAISVV